LLTQEQIKAAILQGQKYKSADEYIDKHLSGKRVRLASVMASDGIKKSVTFFNDWESVVAASASAHQQMREIKAEDIHPTGYLHASVQVSGGGYVGATRVTNRYQGDNAHLVLKAGDLVVQPVVKSTGKQSESALGSWVVGSVGGWRGITLRFDFDVTLEMIDESPVEVILIDGEGHRHQAKANLRGVLGETDATAK
jgi:hypothetical protein